MTTFHAIVWIDRREAHVLMFDREHVEAERIQSRSHHKATGGHVGSHELKHGHGPGTRGGHSPDGGHNTPDEDYYHRVAQALVGVHEILVVGPAEAKNEFRAHCKHHDKAVNDNIVDVVGCDHPTDPELVAMARKYFLRYDQATADPSVR